MCENWSGRMRAFYDWLGSLICHQLPERSLMINETVLPVCARDTGIYIGMFVSLVYLMIKKRWKCDKPPALKITVILCLMIIPMGVDGVSSYLGLRSTTNIIRIITGALFGMTLPFFLMPIAHFKVFAINTRPSLIAVKEIIIVTAVVLIGCMAVYMGMFPSWWVISTIILVTILFIYYRLCYTIVCQVFSHMQKGKIVVALLLQLVVFSTLYVLRYYVLVYFL